MPELPEVETIRLQLQKQILNKKIKEVIIKDKRLLKGISPSAFKQKTEGNKIRQIIRRGKVLVLQLRDELFIVIHLRISGWLELSEEIERFGRVIFNIQGAGFLNFCDQRVLGELRLVSDWQQLPIVNEMGPEPLEITKSEFVSLFAGKKTKIKPLLMDQAHLAGVGNVYAQESLFCAKVHPEKTVDKLTQKELERIYDCLLSILNKAIASKGSSVDTYRQIDGSRGMYVPFLKVYQRDNQPCIKCRTLITRKVIGGRGTCFCPTCQK